MIYAVFWVIHSFSFFRTLYFRKLVKFALTKSLNIPETSKSRKIYCFACISFKVNLLLSVSCEVSFLVVLITCASFYLDWCSIDCHRFFDMGLGERLAPLLERSLSLFLRCSWARGPYAPVAAMLSSISWAHVANSSNVFAWISWRIYQIPHWMPWMHISMAKRFWQSDLAVKTQVSPMTNIVNDRLFFLRVC